MKTQFCICSKSSTNTLNKAIEETRHARHDMRHHLSILNSFVKRKDWADLENYLSQNEQEYSEFGTQAVRKQCD